MMHGAYTYDSLSMLIFAAPNILTNAKVVLLLLRNGHASPMAACPGNSTAIALPLHSRHFVSVKAYMLIYLTLPSTAYNHRLVYVLLRLSFNYPPLHPRCCHRRRRSRRAGHDAAAQQHVELGSRQQ